MERRRNQRADTGTNQHTDCIRTVLPVTNHISKLARIRRAFLKYAVLPIAVLSSSFLTTITNEAYAEVNPSLDMLDKIKPIVPQMNLNPFQPIIDTWNSVTEWFKALPQNIAEWSVELMATLYELCTTLILKTPLWIFDNEWFHNTTYQFSLFSVGIVSILTAVEAIKRMLSGFRLRNLRSTMDLKTILRRWFLVAGTVTAVPYVFQKAFQGLNYISEKLISMGGDTLRVTSLPESIKMFDVITLVLFDVILIATIVPVLWKNGRRFFDIMVLGVASPFALTAWIFDSYRHLFKQWWDSLKHLSLVQIYYALFLLILGWFIFGVPTPDTFTGLIIKLLVVVGGFARMVNPPRLVSKHLDSGGGFDEVFSGKIKETVRGVKKNWETTKTVFSGPKGWAKKMFVISNPEPRVRTGSTRMERYHGKKPRGRR